jgi:two-component system response regulator NreC
MHNKIRLLVADDHNLFRSGIINLLSDEKDIFVVGEAASGKELIERYFELKPDIVLADISMPDMDGIEALKKIKEKDPGVKFLFLSMYEGEEYIYYCNSAGGKGLISKKVLKGELLFGLQTVAENGKYFGTEIDEKKLEEISKKYNKKINPDDLTSDSLTPREKKILELIGEGFTSNEIAEKLFLSKRTIDTHRTHLIQKLNLKSLPELIKYAITFNISNNK